MEKLKVIHWRMGTQMHLVKHWVRQMLRGLHSLTGKRKRMVKQTGWRWQTD